MGWVAPVVITLAVVSLWEAGCGSSNKTAALPDTYNECVRAGWSLPRPAGAIVAEPQAKTSVATITIYPKMGDPAIARCNRINAHLRNVFNANRAKYKLLPESYRRRIWWGKWAYRHGYPITYSQLFRRYGDTDLSAWLSKFQS